MTCSQIDEHVIFYYLKNNFTYLLLFVLVSCASTRKHPVFESSPKQETAKSSVSDSIQLIIHSSNLSEDMSTLSSNDDEVAVFIYNYSDSTITSKPVFSSYFILNKKKMSDTLNYTNNVNDKNNTIIFFLLEIDSDKKLSDIEPDVRLHYKELISAYNKKNYTEIEKYIGDDDLMGIKKIEDIKSNSPVYFEFNDLYKMDRFSYSVTFK
jgi:hypothetical protein